MKRDNFSGRIFSKEKNADNPSRKMRIIAANWLLVKNELIYNP